MLIEIIVGVSSFFGGVIMTTTIYSIYNSWSERRELARRTDELYNFFLEEEKVEEVSEKVI